MEKLPREMVCQFFSSEQTLHVRNDTQLAFPLFQAICFLKLRARLIPVRNRGELAEGWYDPATLRKAQESVASQITTSSWSPDSLQRSENDNGYDGIGPAQPRGGDLDEKKGRKSGPLIPNLQDLQLQYGIHPR